MFLKIGSVFGNEGYGFTEVFYYEQRRETFGTKKFVWPEKSSGFEAFHCTTI